MNVMLDIFTALNLNRSTGSGPLGSYTTRTNDFYIQDYSSSNIARGIRFDTDINNAFYLYDQVASKGALHMPEDYTTNWTTNARI